MTESLHIKTYFSSTVEAAITLARRELGPDAMLMNSRQAPSDVRHLGQYEVVFAASPGLAKEMPVASSQLRSALENSDIESRLIADLLDGQSHTRKSLAARMQSMIATNATLGTTAAVVGPAGRGKTTTLIKLAVHHGLVARRPVRIFSVDNLRVGASAQLGSFATVLGVDFQCFHSVAALDQALKSARAAQGLTLIDTAGYGPLDIGTARDLARCLVSHHVDTHLVLRSDARTSELRRTVERYKVFEPSKFIFTGLDEAESAGSLFTVAVESNKPVSFLGNGPRIPQDLEPAAASRIVDLVLAGGGLETRAAA